MEQCNDVDSDIHSHKLCSSRWFSPTSSPSSRLGRSRMTLMRSLLAAALVTAHAAPQNPKEDKKCFFTTRFCPSEPHLTGQLVESVGTDGKEACFSRAAKHWKECGAYRQSPVSMLYKNQDGDADWASYPTEESMNVKISVVSVRAWWAKAGADSAYRGSPWSVTGT